MVTRIAQTRNLARVPVLTSLLISLTIAASLTAELLCWLGGMTTSDPEALPREPAVPAQDAERGLSPRDAVGGGEAVRRALLEVPYPPSPSSLIGPARSCDCTVTRGSLVQRWLSPQPRRLELEDNGRVPFTCKHAEGDTSQRPIHEPLLPPMLRLVQVVRRRLDALEDRGRSVWCGKFLHWLMICQRPCWLAGHLRLTSDPTKRQHNHHNMYI